MLTQLDRYSIIKLYLQNGYTLKYTFHCFEMEMKCETIVFALFLSSITISFSCGETETTEYANENAQPLYDLIKADSIGFEFGDSNYVFGAIIDATYLIDGRIALLDILQRKILVFSRSGEFIGSAGGEGMGPGEFISPYSLTPLSNGGFAVSDIQQGKIAFFDSSLGLVKELSGFQPMAPDRISIGPDGSVFGRRHNWYYDEDQEEVYSGSEYCLWSDSTQPDQLPGNYFPHSSDDHFFCGISSTDDGRLFTMPLQDQNTGLPDIPHQEMSAFRSSFPGKLCI